MKKVIIFYPYVDVYGGLERNLLALFSAIKKKKLIPMFVCYYDKVGLKKYFKHVNITQLGNHYNPIIKAKRLKSYLEKHDKDIIGLPLFIGEKGAYFAAFFNIRNYVVHYPDPPTLQIEKKSKKKIYEFYKKTRRIAARKIALIGLKRASKKLTMTIKNSKDLKKIYNLKFDVINQGGASYPNKHIDKKKCKRKSLNLFSICRITNSKNLDWIIKGLSVLLNKKPFKEWYNKINLIISGEGPEKKNLIKLTKKLKLQNLIKFTGHIDEKSLIKIYKTTDIVLVPAIQGYGMPVLEALYCNIPVVLNKESRISEILKSNPWVRISKNTKKSFVQSLCKHIKKIRLKLPNTKYLKNLPTEEQWSKNIGIYCNWWKK